MAGGANLTISIFSLPPWLAAAAALMLAALVLVRERVSPVSLSFAATCLTITFWLTAIGVVFSAPDSATALIWVKIALVGVAGILPAVYLFTAHLLHIYERHRRLIWLAAGVSALFALLGASTDLLIGGVYSYSWGYYTCFGPLSIPFLLFFLATMVTILWLHWRAYQAAKTARSRRWHGWLLLALALGSLAGVDGFAAFGVPIYPFGYVFILAFVTILALVTRTHRLAGITPAFAADEIIDTMTGALLLMSPNGIIRAANQAAGELFDGPRSVLIGRSVSDLVPDAGLPQQLEQLLRLGRVRDYELTVPHKSGAKRVFNISASVMADEDGLPMAIVCSAQDISEYKHAAEQALVQSEYLAALHDTSLGLITRLDLSDMLEAIIQRAAQLVGTTHGYIYVAAPEEDELVVTNGSGIFRQNIGFRLKRGQGLAGRVWESGEAMTVNDYHAWADRARSLDSFSFRAVAGVPLTSGGRVVGVIGLAYMEGARIFGPPELDVLNRFAQLASLALDNAQLYAATQQEVAERRRAEDEVRRLAESLERRVAERTAELEAANRELQNEVTERKRAEEERASLLVREQAARASAEEAVRAREVMLSVVSHDLRNPLSAIKGSTSLLRRMSDRARRDDDEQMRAGLTRVDAAANKMNLLIDELLDFARLQAGQQLELVQRATDLVALTRQVAAAYQYYARTHHIVVVAHAPELIGLWDPVRIERVLDNLIANAIKYSPEGSEINVELSREDHDGAWAVLVVRDPGIGIPETDLPFVFDWFHRASNVTGRIKGTGIGLASSRWVIQQHGGSIAVDSQEGLGTTFTVRLQLAARHVGSRLGAKPGKP